MNAIVKKYFRDKPSLAIQAMLDGLKHYSKLPGVEIDMETYGKRNDGICSGCAATWALAQTLDLSPKETVDAINLPRKEEFKPGILGADIEDFEFSVNDFRSGFPRYLLEMCLGDSWDKKIPEEMQGGQSWRLRTQNWQEQLPLIKEYQQMLIELGY